MFGRVCRSSSVWEIGTFLVAESTLFAGFTRVIDTQVVELHWALPIAGMLLSVLWGGRNVLERRSLAILLFPLLFVGLWFVCLPIDHSAVLDSVVESLKAWFAKLS